MTATPPTTRADGRGTIRLAWAAERDCARDATTRGDATEEWRHLERAHILSQPMAWPHLETHAARHAAARRRRDRRELAGQLLRLLLAVPGSVSGRYPAGNTGGADVNAFQPMPIPDDLRSLLTLEDPR
jgi:hypothetical protein